MIPTHLKLKRDTALTIDWSDGTQSVLPIATLRRGCPCATCKTLREQMSKSRLTVLPQTSTPDAPLTVASADLVGNYALRLVWSDGARQGDLFLCLPARARAGPTPFRAIRRCDFPLRRPGHLLDLPGEWGIIPRHAELRLGRTHCVCVAVRARQRHRRFAPRHLRQRPSPGGDDHRARRNGRPRHAGRGGRR